MGDVAELYTGDSIPELVKTSKYTDLKEGYDYIGTKDVGFDNQISYNNGVKIPFSETGFKYSYANSILLCMEGGSAGRKIGLLDKQVCFGNKLCSINALEFDPLYLYYFLQSDFFRQIFKEQNSGIIGGVSIKKFNDLDIPLPPLSEQKRIVAKIKELEPLITRYGEAAEESVRIKTAFPDDLRKAILQYAIEGKLVPQNPVDEPASVLLKKIEAERQRLVREGKIKASKLPKLNEPINPADMPFQIPETWEWVRLGDIGQIVGGGTPKTEDSKNWTDANIPWLTPADMRSVKGKYVSHGERNISEHGLRNSSSQLMPKGSVVYSSRAPIGYIAITNNELCTNQGFKSVVSYVPEIADYLYYVLMAQTPEIISRASGTTFLEISGGEFSKTLVPLPPLEEQGRIVAKVDELLGLCDKLGQLINQSV